MGRGNLWPIGRADFSEPEGPGFSNEHAELLSSTPSLVLRCVWLVTRNILHGPTKPVTNFWG